MSLTATDIGDMVIGVQRDLGRNKFQNIAQSLQHYEVFSKWFKKDKVAFESGIGISRTLLNKVASAASHVGLLESLQVNIEDVLDQLTLDWRHCRTHWALVYQTDILMNAGTSRIVSTVKARRASAMIDMVEELETYGWSAPAVGDKVLPMGVPYWIVKNATTGFTGAYPGSHTDVGGVNLDDSPTFKNYSAQYVNATKGDLVKKARTAHRSCRFRSPISIQDFRGSGGERYRIYVNEATLSNLEDIGEGQNESLGRDLASMDGVMTFRRHPIIWVPELDADTTNPFYMIDHNTFLPACLKGDYLRETEARVAPNQDNVFFSTLWLSYNYLNFDRRRNAVLYV